MRCLQAMLWVHFYRLGEYLTDPFRRHEHVSHVLMEALVNLAPKLLFLLLWALYVVPGMLEVRAKFYAELPKEHALQPEDGGTTQEEDDAPAEGGGAAGENHEPWPLLLAAVYPQ